MHVCVLAGQKGVYTGSTGLTLAYLSGKEGFSSPGQGGLVHFDSDAAQALRAPLTSNTKFCGVDVLLTSQWPKGVEKYGSPPVSFLVLYNTMEYN